KLVPKGWGSVLKNPDRLPPTVASINAGRWGSKFSKTLIDFKSLCSVIAWRWGSVLKNPDRLRGKEAAVAKRLGFSSQKP
ncbi:hypothetical protein ACQXZP_06390, partial [Corynebacterium diphtheriae]